MKTTCTIETRVGKKLQALIAIEGRVLYANGEAPPTVAELLLLHPVPVGYRLAVFEMNGIPGASTPLGVEYRIVHEEAWEPKK